MASDACDASDAGRGPAMLGRCRPRRRLSRSRRGFTLIEVVIAIVILASVMTVAYRILRNILRTERYVSRVSTPEKVGQAILTLMQKDLLGLVYRDLGEFVFQVYDNGDLPDAHDEIQFFTTRNPIMPENLAGQLESGGSDAFAVGYRNITGVVYNLQENAGTRTASVFTLFRQEIPEFDINDPFGSGSGPRTAYEIYDKVRALSIECFDGRDWFPFWESQARLQEEAEIMAEEAEGDDGLARVTAPVGGAPAAEDDLAAGGDVSPRLLPPAGVPVAVRITIVILAGDEKGAYTDERGHGEFKEYTYSTIVPILPAMRIPLSTDEELAQLQDMDAAEGAEGEGGAAGAAAAAAGGNAARAAELRRMIENSSARGGGR